MINLHHTCHLVPSASANPCRSPKASCHGVAKASYLFRRNCLIYIYIQLYIYNIYSISYINIRVYRIWTPSWFWLMYEVSDANHLMVSLQTVTCLAFCFVLFSGWLLAAPCCLLTCTAFLSSAQNQQEAQQIPCQSTLTQRRKSKKSSASICIIYIYSYIIILFNFISLVRCTLKLLWHDDHARLERTRALSLATEGRHISVLGTTVFATWHWH